MKTTPLQLTLTAAIILVATVAGPRVGSADPLAPPSLAPPPPSLGPPSEAPPIARPEAVVPDAPRDRKSPMIGFGLTVGVPVLGLLIGVPLADRESSLGSAR